MTHTGGTKYKDIEYTTGLQPTPSSLSSAGNTAARKTHSRRTITTTIMKYIIRKRSLSSITKRIINRLKRKEETLRTICISLSK
jgi:hypothetical protein